MALTQPMATLFGSGISAAAGLAGNSINADNVSATNAANYRMQQSVNQTNMQIAEKTNAANKELAELAYTRSLPVQQVNNMMAAGMSRGAALQALSGGGSYTAPVMQGSTAQASQNLPKNFDVSTLQSAFERIGNIPMVKQQMDLTDEQMRKLTEEIESLKNRELREQNADVRAQESHRTEQDERLYRRDEQRSYDEVRNALDAALLENGLTYDDIKSRGDMFRYIGKTDAWKNAKGDAITRVFTDISQNRDNIRNERAADDKHEIDQQTLKRLRADLDDFNAEKDTRVKEYKARSIVADIAYAAGVEKQLLMQYSHDLEFTTDEDGTERLRFSRKVSERAKRAWERVADTIGIGIIKDLLGAIRLAG